jgi:FkbM family methyltransferase
MRIAMTVLDRAVEYDMTHDPGFYADDMMANMLALHGGGSCEPEVAHLMFRVLREGDLAVDAGANVGFFTVLMARLVGPTGCVVAFEPAAANLEKLRRNLALNYLGNVDVRPTALWDSAGEMPFWYGHDTGACSLAQYHEAAGSVVVRTETLDDCLDMTPRLIKLDVEGAEERALLGGERWLNWARAQQVPYVTCEMNEDALVAMGSSKESVRVLMRRFGYQMFVLHDDGSLPSLVPPGTRLLSAWKNVNVLFSTVAEVGSAWPEVRVLKGGV